MKYVQKESDGNGKTKDRPTEGYGRSADAMINWKTGTRSFGFRQLINMLDNNFWLLSGMTLGITALIIGWWVVSGQGPGGSQSLGGVVLSSQQSDSIAKNTIEQLENQLSGLTDRVEMLTDSITYLESKLIRAHVLTDSIITAEQRASSISPQQTMPPDVVRIVDELASSAAGPASRQTPAEFSETTREATASTDDGVTTEKSTSRLPNKVSRAPLAPQTDTLSGKQSDIVNTSQDPTRMAAVPKFRAPADKHQTPASKSRGGPWVVNLTSSPSKASADLFAARIRSRGIETQQQQVTVKGKRYWRVQTVGFPTTAEAQAYSEIISEKLGLKDVWIIRR